MNKQIVENTMMKCCRCGIVKELFEFCFRKDTQNYRNQCRDCIKLMNKEYQTMDKDKIEMQRKKYRENIKYKSLKRINDIDYRERNRDKIQFYKKNYFPNNKEELCKKIKKRKDEDINFRLVCNL